MPGDAALCNCPGAWLAGVALGSNVLAAPFFGPAPIVDTGPAVADAAAAGAWITEGSGDGPLTLFDAASRPRLPGVAEERSIARLPSRTLRGEPAQVWLVCKVTEMWPLGVPASWKTNLLMKCWPVPGASTWMISMVVNSA